MSKLIGTILAGGLLFWAVYQALPYFNEWSRHGYTLQGDKKRKLIGNQTYRFSLWRYWQTWLNNKTRQAGYDAAGASEKITLLLVLAFVFGWLAAFLNRWSLIHGLIAGLACAYLVLYQLNHRIEKRKKIFDRELFKIYRFLDLQISSGIKATAAIKGMHEAVQEPCVKQVLIRFSAVYELTFNLEQAAAELNQTYEGHDVHMLLTHLRQALKTGDIGRSLLRMEDLLFARYFNHLQADAQRYRARLIWLALLGLIPTVIVFLFPLFYTAIQAMQQIFL